jgi:hypothetical protein
MGSRVLVAVLALAVLAGGAYVAAERGLLPFGGGDGPESAYARALRAELLTRIGRDGAFGYMVTLPSDAWSTGEGMAGLAALGDPADAKLVGDLSQYVLSRGVMRATGTGGSAFGGYPVGTGDTLGGGEPTGYAVAGIGLARARYGLGLDPETRRLSKFVLSQQNPDGSWSSVFSLGEGAARASATQDCLLALLALEAGEERPTPEVVEAVARAATYIGKTFDAKAGGWFPRQRRAWGGGKLIPGCSEAYAWLLLECGDYLRDAGAALPTVADTALLEYAKAFESQPHPLDFLPATDAEDYVFEVPSGEKTSWGGAGHRWSWVVWRALAVERLARMPANERAEDWKAERERLRNRMRELPAVISKSFTFHVAETLLMVSTLRDAPDDSPLRASLWRRLRAERKKA